MLALAVLVAGCEVPNRLDVRAIARDASGAAGETRLPPPGLDRPTPNLASVPPIPDRPDLATRTRITEGLEQARAASETPLAARRADAPLLEPAAPGQPAVPAQPPPPPRLSRATAIPWTLPTAGASPAVGPAPSDFPQPGQVPAAPGAELTVRGLAPAAPTPDLLAPGAPPPPPPPALLSR